MSNPIKRNEQNGFAMMFAIIVVALFSIVGGVYLKRANAFRELRELEKQKGFQNIELLSEAQRYRTKINNIMDDYLIPNRENSSYTSNATAADFASYVNTSIVAPYNADRNNIANGKRMELICEYEEYSVSGPAIRQPCTIFRVRDPKTFLLSISKIQPEKKVLSRVSEEFAIQRKTINQFAYVLTGARKDLYFGSTAFEGPVGIYFSNMTNVLNGVVFSATSSPGTVFNDTIFTSLTGPQYFVQPQSNVNYAIHKVKFNSDPSGIISYVANQFAFLQNSPSVLNYTSSDSRFAVSGPNPTQKEIEALNYCQSTHPNPAECSLNNAGGGNNSIYGMGSYYIFDGCNIHVMEVVGWDYNDPVNPDHGTNLQAPLNPYVYNGPQQNGQIFYLPGNAFVREGFNTTPGKSSRICASMTLMADGFIIQNSLVKSPTDVSTNLALFSSATRADYGPSIWEYASSNINYYPPAIAFDSYEPSSPSHYTPGRATVFDNGTPAGVTFDTLIQTRTDLPANQVSMELDASLVGGGCNPYYSACNLNSLGDFVGGSFTVPPEFYGAIGDCGSGCNPVPVNLGTLKISGLLMTADPYVTTEIWTINGVQKLGGFAHVSMDQGSVAEYPPPGMNFGVNTGLNSTLMNVSTLETPIGDAIADIRSQ